AMGRPLHAIRIRKRMRTFQSGKLAKASLRGEGAEAVLRYLARYVFRTAIANNRITGLDEDGVTFRHKHRASNRWRQTRLSGPKFMRRFLQHVLPKGLHKVRYFGLWHPSKREDAARARLLLLLDRQATPRRDKMSA